MCMVKALKTLSLLIPKYERQLQLVLTVLDCLALNSELFVLHFFSKKKRFEYLLVKQLL